MHIYRLAASPGYIQHQTSIYNVHPRAQINIHKAFLVPDSCTATERNGYSISTDVTDNAIDND
jgi:hypothetical protein